jgi:hypothetical protein
VSNEGDCDEDRVRKDGTWRIRLSK